MEVKMNSDSEASASPAPNVTDPPSKASEPENIEMASQEAADSQSTTAPDA